MECAASLDVAVVKKLLRSEEITDAKKMLVAVVSMLRTYGPESKI